MNLNEIKNEVKDKFDYISSAQPYLYKFIDADNISDIELIIVIFALCSRQYGYKEELRVQLLDQNIIDYLANIILKDWDENIIKLQRSTGAKIAGLPVVHTYTITAIQVINSLKSMYEFFNDDTKILFKLKYGNI